MEDTANKIKQLTESLQTKQSLVTKKKEEVEALNTALLALEKEVYESKQQYAHSEAEKEIKADTNQKAKAELKKKIELAKRIAASDKASLDTEKEALNLKLQKAQEEHKAKLAQKNELLKSKKGSFVPHEETKLSREEEAKLEEAQTLDVLIKDIEVKTDPVTGFLTSESLTKIIDVTIVLAGRKFRDGILENRKKLRANKNRDLKTFLAHTGKEVSQHTEGYKATEAEVLKALGVDKAILEKSIQYFVQTNNLDIIAMLNLLGDKLKSYLKATKDINKETYRQILEAKLEFIEKEGKDLFSEDNRRKIIQTQLASAAGTYQQKEPMALDILRNFFEFQLENVIYDKFQVEEEDVREAATTSEVQFDLDIAELNMKIEQALYSILPNAAARTEVAGAEQS